MTPRFDIDLGALDANLTTLRARISPAQLMLVVKDDAYGHGIAQVVPRAVAGGIRWVGAFDVPTARAVRAAAGGEVRVFVWMLPSPSAVAEAAALDLDLGVGDGDLLEDVAASSSSAVGASRDVPVRVHLKVDTGLRRNGFRAEDWPSAVRRARALEEAGLLRVVGIWSHIAEASDADDDDARSRFDDAVAEAEAAGLRPELLHLSASSAGTSRPEFRYDLVRVGAFGYGISPAGGSTADELGLRPIGTLVATATPDGRHVRIDVGALHGLPSTLSGRFDVGTPDGPRPVREVGTSSSVLDPWPSAAPGAEVKVFGYEAAATATSLGEAIDSIGEEIVTRLSPQVLRRYLREG